MKVLYSLFMCNPPSTENGPGDHIYEEWYCEKIKDALRPGGIQLISGEGGRDGA